MQREGYRHLLTDMIMMDRQTDRKKDRQMEYDKEEQIDTDTIKRDRWIDKI